MEVSYGARNEGSYRLHHRNVWQYLYFCLVVHNAMRRGRVAKPLRRKIYGQLLKAITFNPRSISRSGLKPEPE